MATSKQKDGAPEGYKILPKATADEDDVEGHQTSKQKDGAPEGQTRKQLFTGEDDDSVEGHKK